MSLALGIEAQIPAAEPRCILADENKKTESLAFGV
jgi:hypothetical protein